MHKLHRFFPTRVFEEDEGLAHFTLEVKGDLRADPFPGSPDAFPMDPLTRFGFHHLHPAETEVNHITLLGFAFGIKGPPLAKSLDRCEGFINFVRRGVDSHSMKNIRHDYPLSKNFIFSASGRDFLSLDA